MNWEDLTHLGPCLQVRHGRRGWLAPIHFPGGGKIPGRHQLRFRPIQNGQGPGEFPNFEISESQQLEILKRVRPSGNSDTENAKGSWFRVYAPEPNTWI